MCDHIDTEEDLHGNIRCVQKGGCGKVVALIATKEMANAAITYLGKQRVQDLEELDNRMIRGMIDAALTLHSIQSGATITDGRQQIITEIRRLAESQCEGCRLSWKLRYERHGEPMPVHCAALHLRQAIIYLTY